MKYFLIMLIGITGLLSVKGKIPDFIKVCKRDDPNLEECIQDSIQQLKPKLNNGIPELGVPSIEPLIFDKVDIELGAGLKTEMRNLELRGLKDFNFNSIKVDLATNTFNINISIPEVEIRGTYDMNAAIGSIPLKGKGPIYFAPKSIIGIGTLHGKKVNQNGKTLFYFNSMDLKLTIGDYKIKLDNLFGGDPAIGEVTNKLLNEEKIEVLAALKPGLEKAVIKKILFIGNHICKHFTWDELFPES